MSVILWSLVTTILTTAALLLVLTGDFSNKALWVALSVPIVWSTLQFLCYHVDSPRHVVFTQLALSIVSGSIIFFSTPQI